MIIALYENDIVTNVYNCNNLQQLKSILQDKNYKVFENSKIHIGENINKYNNDGSVKELLEQIELGFITLHDYQKIENNTIVSLSQDELVEKFPYSYIKTADSTNNKTLVELFDEKQSELEVIRKQILDAQADEEDELLPDLRAKRDAIKSEIASLEAEIG